MNKRNWWTMSEMLMLSPEKIKSYLFIYYLLFKTLFCANEYRMFYALKCLRTSLSFWNFLNFSPFLWRSHPYFYPWVWIISQFVFPLREIPQARVSHQNPCLFRQRTFQLLSLNNSPSFSNGFVKKIKAPIYKRNLKGNVEQSHPI